MNEKELCRQSSELIKKIIEDARPVFECFDETMASAEFIYPPHKGKGKAYIVKSTPVWKELMDYSWKL